jgi:opacity protein-like surface antigen
MCFTYKIARVVLSTTAAVLFGLSIAVSAQQPFLITKLTVLKKPGQSDGLAMATVGKRTGVIASHALQGWIVLGGNGAVLLLSPEKKDGPYRLRYYQADEGKGRLLGYVPFPEAKLVELQMGSTVKDFTWAFVVSGNDASTKRPFVFAGDTEAIHARLENSKSPQFANGSLSFQQDGQPRTIPVSTLLGNEALGRIYKPSEASPKTSLLEFLSDGEALTFDSTNRVERGRWLTDGSNFIITSPAGAETTWPISHLQPVTGIPAANRLSVRLLQPLSSRTATEGMPVKAVLITPGVSDTAILLPQGSEFDGSVVSAHGVGWGIKHETAALTVRFNEIRLPNGRTLPIAAHVFEVENAREHVTEDGKIQGVRATGTFGHSAEKKVAAVVQIDPIAYVYTATSGPAVLGFAESEILYNAGSEMILEFDQPVITSQQYPPPVPSVQLSGQQDEQLNAIVRDLSYRTRTQGSNKPSDLTNLIFIGSPSAIRRAFEAAGWSSADVLDAASTFDTVKALSGNASYSQAPMSTLLLDEQPPLFTLQKSTNTFSSRHHVRVFATGQTLDQQTILTASSTQDIAIAFSGRQKTFIHVIDQDIDNERSKVTNDLVFTGCVVGVDLMQRPWVPRDAYNSTGDRLLTDGDAALLQFNNCTDPHTTPTTPAARPPVFERAERNFMLSLKDTLYRGNLVYEGISSGQMAHSYFVSRRELGEAPANWRKSDASGTQYDLYEPPRLTHRPPIPATGEPPQEPAGLDAVSSAQIASHRWDPPRFEIGVNFGYSTYRTNALEVSQVLLVSSIEEPYFINLNDDVYDGWAAGVTLTINSWNWISNEFTYTREQTKFDLYELGASGNPNEPVNTNTRTVGLTTRRFAYNAVLNLRPRKSRWRPYITAGPAFQLVALADAPLKKPSGYFVLGLSNIGLIKAAFDFGNTPPLNGGGIYQLGLQYGAGFKYRVLPRLTMRVDYGETWSQTPRIIRDSYISYEPPGLDNTYATHVLDSINPAKYVQQRATAGFAFTF